MDILQEISENLQKGQAPKVGALVKQALEDKIDVKTILGSLIDGMGVVGRRFRDGEIYVPAGVPYDELRPEDFVVVDLNGKIVDGKLKPSVDTATHLYIYKRSQ